MYSGELACCSPAPAHEVSVLDHDGDEPAPDVETAAAAAFRHHGAQIVQPHAPAARCWELLLEQLPNVHTTPLDASPTDTPLPTWMPPAVGN